MEDKKQEDEEQDDELNIEIEKARTEFVTTKVEDWDELWNNY